MLTIKGQPVVSGGLTATIAASFGLFDPVGLIADDFDG
jgi:hypothetical protein